MNNFQLYKKDFIFITMTLLISTLLSMAIYSQVKNLHRGLVIFEFENLVISNKLGTGTISSVKSSEALKLIELLQDKIIKDSNLKVKKTFFNPISDRLLEVKAYGNKSDIASLFEQLRSFFINQKSLINISTTSSKNNLTLYYSETKFHSPGIQFKEIKISRLLMMLTISFMVVFLYFLARFIFSSNEKK